jgi:hypothetical protein
VGCNISGTGKAFVEGHDGFYSSELTREEPKEPYGFG